jgi:hypothetical protein
MKNSIRNQCCFVRVLVLVGFSVLIGGCVSPQADKGQEKWIQLFNGKNLDGWTPKIAKYGNTFRVEDGVMRMVFDQYKTFDDRFGHIFYKEKFSNYRLRAEYRFTGEQTAGGADWAYRNSGLMLHCQPPATMTKDQSFPVCIEVQLLGGNGKDERSTGNLCTPGTNVTQHCISSTSKTFHGDQWVTIEVEVHGNGAIRHFINGEKVLEYSQPQLDENDGDAKRMKNELGVMLHEGYIALQAESHPVEFRKVELLPLSE